MNWVEAEAIAGTLSAVSKGNRQWASWGIPAICCDRGSLLARYSGTVCRKCYARNRGNYRFSNVFAAQIRRLDAVDHPKWVESMVCLIRQWDWFRWFDSGDVQSIEMLDKILEVCDRCPDTRFWLPTHEPYIVGERLDAIPDNLCVRISADLVEDRPTTPTWGLNTSTVHRFPGEPVPAASGNRKHSIECRAYVRDKTCGNCRACWLRQVPNVSYLQHG